MLSGSMSTLSAGQRRGGAAMTADVITGHWVELAVTCAPEAVEVVAALFSEYGLNEGVVIEEAFTQETDGDVEVDPSRPAKVSTYLDADDSEGVVDDMREAIARIGEEHDVSGLLVRSMVVPKCEHEDWADAWQAHFSLLRVGRRTVVRAPWHDYDPAPDEILIEIEAGMAFGVGGHPSTH